MTTQANLNTLITNSNVLLDNLQNLLGGLQPNVLLSDNPALYPAPVLGLDGTWTMTQTQETGGIYEGRYSLVGAYSCATIDFIDKTNYTPPLDNIGAQYRVCGGSTFTNLATVDDLENKQADSLVIRSTTAFTVRLKLTAQWCYSIDFTSGNQQGWQQRLVVKIDPKRGVVQGYNGLLAQIVVKGTGACPFGTPTECPS